jgi:hypothetical protein
VEQYSYFTLTRPCVPIQKAAELHWIQYMPAKSDVFDAKTYASCVRDSDGHDDCSSECSSSQSEQDDFESAVSDYEGDAASKASLPLTYAFAKIHKF